MCVYLRTKVQVSSVILTSVRQGVNFTPHLKTDPLKSAPRLGLKYFYIFDNKNDVKFNYVLSNSVGFGLSFVI